MLDIIIVVLIIFTIMIVVNGRIKSIVPDRDGSVVARSEHIDTHITVFESYVMSSGDVNGNGWEDVIGLESIKDDLMLNVVHPMASPDKYNGLSGPPRGVLLSGPPGTGKTLIARAMAVEANSSFMYITAAQISSKWIGEGEKSIEALFWVARKHAPCIIFLDEVESIFPTFGGNNYEAHALTNCFKACLDGFSRDTGRPVVVIAATNNEDLIDHAIMSRLDMKIRLSCPDMTTIVPYMIRRECNLNRVTVKLSDVDLLRSIDDPGNDDVRTAEANIASKMRRLIRDGITVWGPEAT